VLRKVGGPRRRQTNRKVVIIEKAYREAFSCYCICGLFGKLMKDRSERARGTLGDVLKSRGKLGPVHPMNAYRENRRTAPIILNPGFRWR
jgi:hypothetical protein